MEFRQLVTAEASTLVERLVAATAAEVEATTGRIQAAADAALAMARAETDQLKSELDKARADEKTARSALEKIRAEEKTLRATVEKTRAEQQVLQSALEKARSDEKTLQTALEKTRADEQTLQATVEKMRADEQALQSTVEKLRTEDKKRQVTDGALQAALQKEQERSTTLQTQLKQAAAARAVAETEYKKAQAAAERAAAQKAAAEKELEEAMRLAAAATSDRDAIADDMQRAEATWLEQTRGVRDQVSRIASAPLDHLRAAFQRLEAASTVAGALTALVSGLAAEFSRVALFHVNGNRLEGRQQTGFDFASDISKVAVPLTKGSALAEAVRSGRVQGLTAADLSDSSRKLFGGTPTFVLILPVVIGSEIAAVLYADNSDQPQPQFINPQRGVSFAEVLLLYSVPLLARLSAEEKVLDELREYGTQLLSDLESVYSGDVTAGHKGDKLQRRLQHNLEYARSMFTQRVESRGAIGAALFDEQLAAVITQKSPTSFGRDLAAVVASLEGKLSAEAS